MKIRYFSLLLAGVGIAGAISFSLLGNKPESVRNQIEHPAPPSTPYDNTVSGTGMVEANSRNISIGSHLSGIVKEVLVQEGLEVKKGDTLFTLDDRDTLAEFLMYSKEMEAAQARVQSARANLADEKDQLERIEKLKPGEAVTIDRQQRQRFAFKKAQSALNQALAEAESAKARLAGIKVTMAQLAVKSPID